MTTTCIICGRAAEQGSAEWSAADVILREPEQDALAGPLPNYASQAPVCNPCVRSLCAKVLLDAIDLADGLTISAEGLERRADGVGPPRSGSRLGYFVTVSVTNVW
ncbi:MAG: hypothetical protein WCF68_07940 [Terriglobales bacterium]